MLDQVTILLLYLLCYSYALMLLFYCLSKRIAKEEQKECKRKAKEIMDPDGTQSKH